MMTTDTAPAPSGPGGRGGRIGRRLVGQICLVGLMITIVLSGFFFTNWNQQTLIDLREGGRQMRIAQEGLMEAEAYVLNKATGDQSVLSFHGNSSMLSVFVIA